MPFQGEDDYVAANSVGVAHGYVVKPLHGWQLDELATRRSQWHPTKRWNYILKSDLAGGQRPTLVTRLPVCDISELRVL
jgi:hypothetical protein